MRRQITPRFSYLLATGLLSLAIGVGCGGQEGANDGAGEQAPGTGEMVGSDPADAEPETRTRPTRVDEIVALFPKDLPEWDEATLTEAAGGLDGEGVQTLDSDASPVAAIDFYRSRLEAQGWDLATEKTVDDFTMLEFMRGGEILTVMVEPNGSGGTQVNLVNR